MNILTKRGVGDFYAMLATNGRLNMFGVLGCCDDIPVKASLNKQ
jgi:hypothetical protein